MRRPRHVRVEQDEDLGVEGTRAVGWLERIQLEAVGDDRGGVIRKERADAAQPRSLAKPCERFLRLLASEIERDPGLGHVEAEPRFLRPHGAISGCSVRVAAGGHGYGACEIRACE